MFAGRKQQPLHQNAHITFGNMYVYDSKTKELVIDVTVLASVPALNKIYKRDRTAEKEVAKAQLALIFHMFNPRSPYYNYDSSTRMMKVIIDLFDEVLKKWKDKITEDSTFKEACDMYHKFLELIPERALLTAAQDAVHDLATKISDKDTKNKEVLLRTMKQAVTDLKEVREDVMQTEEKLRQIKGGRIIKRREDPSYLGL